METANEAVALGSHRFLNYSNSNIQGCLAESQVRSRLDKTRHQKRRTNASTAAIWMARDGEDDYDLFRYGRGWGANPLQRVSTSRLAPSPAKVATYFHFGCSQKSSPMKGNFSKTYACVSYGKLSGLPPLLSNHLKKKF